MVETVRLSAAMVVAFVAHHAGFEPGTGQVAMVGLRGRRVIGSSVCGWDAAPGQERVHAEQLAIVVDATMQGGDADTYIVLGYGPDGADRALLLSETLIRLLSREVRDTLHVHGDTVRVWDPVDNWGPPLPVPDFTDQAALIGFGTPAASSEELSARFQPLDRPTYEPLPPEASAALANIPPAELLNKVRRVIEAAITEGSVDPQDRAFVIAAANSSVAALEATVAWAAQTRQRTDFLVSNYRGAPETSRAAAATLAVAALMLSIGHRPGICELLDHAETTGPGARLTRRLHAALHLGTPHDKLLRDLDATVPATLAHAAESLGADIASLPDLLLPHPGPETDIAKQPLSSAEHGTMGV